MDGDGSEWVVNEAIKSALVGEYKSFVDSVEPCEVMDVLIAERVMSTEEWNKLEMKETRQDKCRFILDKIFTTTNPRSCIVLHEALKEYYPWIHDNINSKIILKKNSLINKLDVRELMERMDLCEKKKIELFKEKDDRIKYLENERNVKGNGVKDEGKEYEDKLADLERVVREQEKELKLKEDEVVNLNSHVSILESQIKASASRSKSINNIDFDDGVGESLRQSLEGGLDFKEEKSELRSEGGVRIIKPDDVIRVNKLPRYCGPFYDLYNGRFGNECLSISIKEAIKGGDEDRLQREAHITCHLHHPRLSRLLGQSGDVPVSYLVYESSHIPNALNYFKYFKNTPAIVDHVLIVRWCVQMACGLEHIHSKGILLRNLKLENVLVVSHGKSIKLTNFNSAVHCPEGGFLDPHPPTDRMENLALETWRDKMWYEATDVWSFALTSIKLLNKGKKLFPSQTARDLRSMIMAGEGWEEKLGALVGGVRDESLRRVLLSCLSCEHHTRTSIQPFTLFNTYASDTFCNISEVKAKMAATFCEHVIENKMQVRSMTSLNNHLHFLVNSSSAIKTYCMSNGYEKLASIKLGLSRRKTLKQFFQSVRKDQHEAHKEEDLKASQKLLSICAADECLYVLDGQCSVVWQVVASKRRVLQSFKVPQTATSIHRSSHNQCLLIFCSQSVQQGFYAEEYSLDGRYLRKVVTTCMPQPLISGAYLDSLHILVLTGLKQQDQPGLTLNVIDYDGTLSSGYGSVRVNNISDMCVHTPSNTILLADLSKNRILLLDGYLQCEAQVLFDVEQGISCPSALHITPDGTLFVGLVSGNVCCFHYKNTQSLSS